MLNKLLLFFVSLLFMAGCASSERTFSEKESVLKKISADKYGERFGIFYNSDSTYALIIRKEKAVPLFPNPGLHFFIYNINYDKIIFDENLSSGYAAWIDVRRVEARISPEVISIDEKNNITGYIYDVKSEIKSKLNPASEKQNP